ncbi:MAG: hypothetical protein ACXU8U_02375, partial [Asticcacaulis sp.]
MVKVIGIAVSSIMGSALLSEYLVTLTWMAALSMRQTSARQGGVDTLQLGQTWEGILGRFLILAALTMGLLSAHPVAAGDVDPEARYHALVAAAKAKPDPSKVNWQELRFAAAERPSFSFDWNDDDRKALFRTFALRDPGATKAAAERVLEKNYVDGMAHRALGAAEIKLGKTEEGQRELSIAEGIFQSIRTGDGLSFEHAFTVIAI